MFEQINKFKASLNENMPTPDNDTDASEYVLDFQRKVVSSGKIIGWRPYMDKMSGSIDWSKPGIPNVVLATPFWDENPTLPINITNDDGGELFDKVLKFVPTYDMNKDMKTYKKLLVKYLKMAEKIK